MTNIMDEEIEDEESPCYWYCKDCGYGPFVDSCELKQCPKCNSYNIVAD